MATVKGSEEAGWGQKEEEERSGAVREPVFKNTNRAWGRAREKKKREREKV
jgi:hypothetical protein